MRISLCQEEITKNNPELQKKLHPIVDSMNNAIKIFLVKKERKTMTERNFDNNNENCIEFYLVNDMPLQILQIGNISLV